MLVGKYGTGRVFHKRVVRKEKKASSKNNEKPCKVGSEKEFRGEENSKVRWRKRVIRSGELGANECT